MRRAFFLMIVVAFAVAGVGCPCARSAVNASPELRWWLFSNFGASKICPEMLKRGVPLKLPQLGAASVGRFFPSQCNVQVDDARKAIVMTASGSGYVMLPFTRRVGFYVGMGVEYLPDFRLEEDATYVWGKFNRFVAQPDLRILGVENPVVNLATQTPFGNVATVIGTGIVTGEIGRGFTVVRQESGDDFTLGHLDPPAKPARQFKPGEGRVLLASDLTTVYAQSREFLGPFEVAQDDAALYLRARTTGAPITYALVERSVGENWRRQYETAQPLGPPPGVLVGHGPIAPGEVNLGFPLNRGTYYIVLENPAVPPLLGGAIAVGEQSAQVSYSVELGERR
ncbi:MAG TPA: hypothetical protein VM925_00250 [Labilithrix sp.]|nr:hypothetical protein [Labilithrix sp.]